MQETLIRKTLPQDPSIEVWVPNYKEPILPVNHGGFGWYGLQAYNQEGQLMCHECGEFWDSLGHHLPKHGVDKQTYKRRYGLRMLPGGLSSVKSRAQRRLSTMNSPDYREKLTKLAQTLWTRDPARRKVTPRNALEILNARDSCPQQIIRRLLEAAEIYGSAVTEVEARCHDGNLVSLTKLYFGSFNKAKQIAKLITNPIGARTVFTEAIILEDMRAFFGKYGRWPKTRDYDAGGLICSRCSVAARGGINALRLKAMKLKETQDAAAQQAERIPAFAESIKRELAGSARV